MKARSPLHDPIDVQLVPRLVSDMKAREQGTLDPATLVRDVRILDEEIAFAEERARLLKERCVPIHGVAAGDAHAQAFGALLQDTEQELYRLYNARQFLRAEVMLNDGVPSEQIATTLQLGDPERRIG